MPASEHSARADKRGRDGFTAVISPPGRNGKRAMDIRVFGAFKASDPPALLEKARQLVEHGELAVDATAGG